MAVIDTSGPGRVFADAATVWSSNGGVAPTAPDQARILHDVTVDGDWDIGVSPDDPLTDAIRVESGGSITFAANVNMTLRGSLGLNSGLNMTVNEGCNFTFNDTLAAAAGNTYYALRAGTSHNSPLCRVTCNGISSNRITFTGTGPWQWSARADGGGHYANGEVDLNYCNISGLRYEVASGDPIAVRRGGMRIAASPTGSRIRNCVFDDCEFIYVYPVSSPQTLTVEGTKFTNDLSGRCLYFSSNAANATTIVRSTLSGILDLSYNGTTLNNCVLPNGGIRDVGSGTGVSSISNLAIRGAANITAKGTLADLYISNTNANVKLFASGGVGVASTISGCIVEGEPAGGSSGEMVSLGTGNITVTRCITLKRSDASDGPVVLTEQSDTANSTRLVKNCTFYHRGSNVGHSGAGGTTPLGALEFKDNIGHGELGCADCFGILDLRAAGISDFANPADLDYNCWHNIPEDNKYSNVQLSGGTPGSNDLVADPQFVDNTVNILTFSQSLGGPATFDGAWDELSKTVHQDPGYISGFTIAALLEYIRNGMTPRNTALRGAGSDGSDIGAVPVSATLQTTVDASNVVGSDSVVFDWFEEAPP